MKNFLILLLAFLAFQLSAQNTIVQGAWWFFEEKTSLGPPETTYHLNWVEGEVDIDNTSYAIMKHRINNVDFADSYYYETDNNVYRYSPENEQAELIYDFNLLMGELLTPIGLDDFSSNNFEISEINTIDLRNGTQVNQFIFEQIDAQNVPSFPNCSMVERLGSISGLFGSYGSECTPYTDANITKLLGYGIGEEILYSDPVYGELQTQLELINSITIDLTRIALDNITFHPNPSNDFITIDNNLQDTQYQIVDISGKTILTTKETSINLSNLSNGIYYLVANINNSISTHKLIKM